LTDAEYEGDKNDNNDYETKISVPCYDRNRGMYCSSDILTGKTHPYPRESTDKESKLNGQPSRDGLGAERLLYMYMYVTRMEDGR
jgi:hypothetical protein